MTPDAAQKSPSSAKFERQFIAPYPLEICKEKLDSRTQPPTWWAWAGQTRIQVDTRDVDDDTIHFRVHMPRRTARDFTFAFIFTKAEGLLFRQADGTTRVTVSAATTPLAYVAFFLPFAFLCLWFITWFQESSLLTPLHVVVSGLVFLVALPFIHRHFKQRRASLLAIVENTLS